VWTDDRWRTFNNPKSSPKTSSGELKIRLEFIIPSGKQNNWNKSHWWAGATLDFSLFPKANKLKEEHCNESFQNMMERPKGHTHIYLTLETLTVENMLYWMLFLSLGQTCRDPLKNVSCTISKLLLLLFLTRRHFNILFYICKENKIITLGSSQFWPKSYIIIHVLLFFFLSKF
jgi:hypothetical protein